MRSMRMVIFSRALGSDAEASDFGIRSASNADIWIASASRTPAASGSVR